MRKVLYTKNYVLRIKGSGGWLFSNCLFFILSWWRKTSNFVMFKCICMFFFLNSSENDAREGLFWFCINE